MSGLGLGYAMCADPYGRGLPEVCGDKNNPNIELDVWNYFDPNMFRTPGNLPYIRGNILYVTEQPGYAEALAAANAGPSNYKPPSTSTSTSTTTATTATKTPIVDHGILSTLMPPSDTSEKPEDKPWYTQPAIIAALVFFGISFLKD